MSGLLPYGECIAPYVYTPLNGSIYPTSKEFEHIVEGLSDALDFSRTIGIESMPPYEQGGAREAVGEVDFYTSHEGLMLDYEQALTREFPLPPSLATKDKKKAYYNAGAHFLWIGDRTRQLTGAHVEYFRGIRNPIGIKVGPSMVKDELVRLLDSTLSAPSPTFYSQLNCINFLVVNPDKESGRVTLITRYGATKVGGLIYQ